MKVFVLQTIDADDETTELSVYQNLDKAKTAAQAWFDEQLAIADESAAKLEWEDHPKQSNPTDEFRDEYPEKIFIWVRDLIE